MIKIFFQKFFTALTAILFVLLCGIIGIGTILFVIWLFCMAKWIAIPVIIIIMALIYAGMETYEEWNIQRKRSIEIEIKMLKEEQKKLHIVAAEETDYKKLLNTGNKLTKFKIK